MAAAAAVFSLLLSCVSAAAADADGNRRILHEPLYPIQWTPPSPPSDDADPFPQSPAPPLASPTQPDAASTQTAADASVSAPTHHSITVPAKLAIGISASVCTVAILSLFAYFLHRRRARTPSESRKLIAGSGDSRRFVPPDRPAAAAAAEFLYLGTMEPAVPGRRPSAESNGSPYRKLISERERVLELHHPSPELHPLPPLTGPGRRLDPPQVTAPPPPPPPAASSDDDTYYTPNRSVASRNSESSGSPRSRRSHAASSAAGKDARTASPADNVPHSRRSSPRMQLSSDVNRGSSAAPRAAPPPPTPPPPPPPPPLPLKTEKDTKLTPPRPPLLPKTEKVNKLPPSLLQDIVRGNREGSSQQQPLPAWPSSRRQLMRPLPPEDAARADVRAPTARLINGDGSSSLQPAEEAGDDLESEAKPKLKPLHWDKVLASSDRAMVWDQLKSDTFQLNEDMIETLFVNNSVPPPPKEQYRRVIFPPLNKEDRVLDPKKSQNIAILLRALNVTREEVSDALLDGNTDGLGSELLETLVKMAPTKEEELKLRDYNGDVSKLGSAERFLKAVLDIPFAFRRVDVMLYRANFDTEVKYLRTSFETLEAACEDLTSSRLFLKLLEAVLRTGNRMNVGTNRGEAKAFKLDTLLKLADVKGTDGKTSLLHFVVQEIIRSEGSAFEVAAENHPIKAKEEEFRKHGLQVVSGLSSELRNVKKAAGMDSDVLSSYLSKLELGLEKIRSVLQLGRSCEQGQMFFDNTRTFLQEAELEIGRVESEEKRALRRVREVTEYFHGDAAKEGAHPLRIFLVVRDFLTVLDNVCKDVGRLHERTMKGSAKSFRISASSSLPVLQRYAPRQEANSDEDSSSS